MLKRGFSLMEMMIVMLIVAVVAAASAPMINKKMLQDQANDSPWIWTGADNSIAYNLKGIATQTAVIGAIKAPQKAVENKSKLHIQSDGTQITLEKKDFSNNFNIIATGSASDKKTNSIYIVDNTSDMRNGSNNVLIGSGIKTSSGNYPNMTLVGAETYGEHFSTAIGYKSSAKPAYGGGGASTAVGAYSQTNGQKAVAIGVSNGDSGATKATNKYALAVGSGANASGESSIAIGGADDSTNAAKAEKTGSIAIGRASVASVGDRSLAIGYGAKAKNNSAIAIGDIPEVTGEYAIGIGEDIAVTKKYGIAIGSENYARGEYAIVIGKGAGVSESKDFGVAIGNNAKASLNGTALGRSAEAISNEAAVALGYSAEASGYSSVAISDALASKSYTVAIGDGAQAKAGCAISIGSSAICTDAASGGIAIGDEPIASGANSIVIGGGEARATASKSMALGHGAEARHESSTAIGAGAVSTKSNQIVLGTSSTAVYIPGDLVVDRVAVLGAKGFNPYLCVDNDGYSRPVTIKKGSPDLHVGTEYGNNHVGGYNTSSDVTSDRRLKNIGEAFKGGLAEIKKLEVFNYTFKEDKDKTPRVGVMAQDLQKIFPKAVFKGEDGFLRIRMEDMFYALVNAVKELDAKIQALKDNEILVLQNKVSALEKQNKEFEKTIDKLEKRLEKLEKG